MLNEKYNEDNFDILSDSSDSDDDKENYYSSSSSVSIPWAEDAIKNNQQIWERIERIFYDEEELPEDDKEFRREILEWKKAFPQLRVQGNKISDPSRSENSTPINSEEEEDDIILLNPNKLNNFPSNVNNYKRSQTKKITTFRKSANENLPSLFEKDLRISSVPMINRRKQIGWDNKSQNLSKIKSQHEYPIVSTLPKTIPQLQSSLSRPTFEIISSQPTHYNSIAQKNYRHINKSASFVRMPPIFSIITPTSATKTFLASHHKPTKIYFSNNINASKPETRKTTVYQQLPAINLNPNYNIERSISAALNYHRQINAATSYLPFSASKLKFSK